MNNKIPECFSTIKPKLPEIIEHYEIRNPVFHLPATKHKFAEYLLQYCLIKQINEEHCFSMISDKVQCSRHLPGIHRITTYAMRGRFLVLL